MLKNKKKKTKKIVITGGHAGSTSYATIEELKENSNIDWDIYFIGARSGVEGKNLKTLESEVFPKIGVKFQTIISGRIQRKLSLWTLPSLFKIPLGFIDAFFKIAKIKPDITLSFGGFTAFPVVFASYLFRIPVIIHEQTTEVGLANKYSSYFAKHVAVARHESIKHFPNEKCVVTGNPISKEITGVLPKYNLSNPPTIFVTGGARGSAVINSTVSQVLEDLLKEYKVIHQTGLLEYDKLNTLKNNLPSGLRHNYEVYGLIESWRWYKFIEKADLIISRSGANIVSEIIATKRPSILIPIPFSYKNEQLKNAEYAKNHGAAEIIEQKYLDKVILLSTINKVLSGWNEIVKNIKNPQINDREASAKLVKLIEDTV